jgi:hypothetical protein
MTRTKLTGANAPSESKKPNVVNRALRASAANAAAEPPAWLKPISHYRRHQNKAFAVTRFG